jgi:hypothetical protein
MLTAAQVKLIITRLSQIRPEEPEIRKELQDLVKWIIDKDSDPNWVPVDDTDTSEDESDGEGEEYIIDRSDPNFISIS